MPTTLRLFDAAGQPGQVLRIPLNWHEVSLQQFVAAYAPEPVDEEAAEPAPLLVEALLGLPAGTLATLPTDQALGLSARLAFVLDLDQMLNQAPPAAAVPDVGSRSFGSLLLAQQHTQAHEGRPWPAYGPYVLALYRVETAWGKQDEQRVQRCLAAMLADPVTASAPACKAVLAQIDALAEQYKPAEEDVIEPTEAEYDAGSEELAANFGVMLSLDAAAGGLVTNYEAVLKQDAATVLAKLMLDNSRNAFYRRLQQAQQAQHSTH